MPSKSAKQKKTMQAAKNNPAFAKKIGIRQKVAEEYVEEDKKPAGKKRVKKKSRKKS